MTAASNVTTESASYSWLVAQRTVERQTGRHASLAPSRETQQLCADGRYVNTGVPLRRPHEFAALDKWLKDLGLDAELPEAVFLEMGANWDGRCGWAGANPACSASETPGRLWGARKDRP